MVLVTSSGALEIMQYQTDTRIKCVQAWLMIKIMRHFDRLATKCVQAQLIHEAATNEEKCEKCIRSEETWYSEASVIFSTASQRMSIYPLVDLLGSIIGVFQIGNFCSSLLWSMLWVPDWVPNWCHPIFWGPQDLPKVSDYGSFYGAWLGPKIGFPVRGPPWSPLGVSAWDLQLGWPFIFISSHPCVCKLWPEWFPTHKR